MTSDRPKITRTTGPAGQSYELIDVPNRLAQKAGDFHVDPASAARVQARLDALSERYPDMAQPEFEKMAELWQLLRAGAGNAKDNAKDNEAFQHIIHDFKGHGGSVGYPLITEIAASLGELMRKADLTGDAAKQAIDQHVAAIGAILHGRNAGDGGAAGQALIAGLRLLAAKCLRDHPAP